MDLIYISLVDEKSETLFQYESSCVPRKGEHFILESDTYEVSDVTWFASEEDGMWGVNVYLESIR